MRLAHAVFFTTGCTEDTELDGRHDAARGECGHVVGFTAGGAAPARKGRDGNRQQHQPRGEPSCTGLGAMDAISRDQTGCSPRFERCFIGLITASRMMVNGERKVGGGVPWK